MVNKNYIPHAEADFKEFSTNYELGNNQVIWDTEKQASGIYFYKLVVGDKAVDTKKMILLK